MTLTLQMDGFVIPSDHLFEALGRNKIWSPKFALSLVGQPEVAAPGRFCEYPALCLSSDVLTCSLRQTGHHQGQAEQLSGWCSAPGVHPQQQEDV